MASLRTQSLLILSLRLIRLTTTLPIDPATSFPSIAQSTELLKRASCDTTSGTCPDTTAYWKYILIPIIVIFLVIILFVALITCASKYASPSRRTSANQTNNHNTHSTTRSTTTRSRQRSFFSDFMIAMTGVHPTAPLAVPISGVTPVSSSRMTNTAIPPKISTTQTYEINPNVEGVRGPYVLTPPPKSFLRSTSSLSLVSPTDVKGPDVHVRPC